MTTIITWAQNATSIHPQYWANLKAYARKCGANLIVQAGVYNPRYRASTEQLEDGDDLEWWDKAVLPYLVHDDVPICDGVVAYAGCNIRPTRIRPLGGKRFWGGGTSGIFGHPKFELRCESVPGSRYPKLQMTTGACTVANYSDSDSGRQANAHHHLGAIIVDVEEPDDDGQVHYHVRHIHATSDQGDFFDTRGGKLWHVSRGKVRIYRDGIPAIIVGDSHVEQGCSIAQMATREMIKTLRPERIFLNDLMSASAQSKHTRGKHYHNWLAHKRGDDIVETGLRLSAELIEYYGATDLVDSNHHDHLDQWCDDTTAASDVQNQELWHMLNWLRRKHQCSAMEAWLRHHPDGPRVSADFRFNRRGESVVVGKWAILHGHEGPNGARGIRGSGHHLGRRIVSAHTHSPYALGGHAIVGHTSWDDHGYNNPVLSNWLQGNGVIYPNGKFQHLHIIMTSKGVWRLP